MNEDELSGYLACCNLLSLAVADVRRAAEAHPLAGVAARRELNIVADHMGDVAANLVALAKDDRTPGHPIHDMKIAGSPSPGAAAARTEPTAGAI